MEHLINHTLWNHWNPNDMIFRRPIISKSMGYLVSLGKLAYNVHANTLSRNYHTVFVRG